jgi:PAS domain S-box-containing protein
MSQGHVASRHRLLLILLWAHVLLLAGLGLLAGASLTRVAVTSLLLIMFALAGMLLPGQVPATIAVALGLVTTSMVLAGYTSQATIASLHLLVMVGAISLYRMWQPLLFSVLAATGYQFLSVGSMSSETLADAAIQSGLAVLLALILAAGWRLPGPDPTEAGALNRLRMAFEEAPFGMAILKPSGEFIQVNGAMGQLLGYRPEEMIGRNIRSIVHHDDMVEVGEAWEQMGNEESHSAVSWLRCTTASGSTLWGKVSLSLVPHTPEHPAMVVLQIEDAPRSFQEKRALEDLLSGKDEFVAAVGDEISEPLERLIDLTDGNDTRLHQIRGYAHRVASIVDDLVASARSVARSRPVAALPLDAATLCHDVVTSIAGNDRVVVDVEATDIWADPALTRQVISGLVGHAVRFGGANIRVRTLSSGPDTVIEVIDDGPEIPESERERVFRSDLHTGSPSTRPATVGLGLTVGRRLARQMDGDLTYRRTVEGENVFELRLPSEQFVSDSRRTELDVSA